ncbi:hypothetical protein MKEN_00569700 [Mycena kentingensis (nom. inval.)]|nr:hypothetical protein MKEN_00570100 [Mycena kentingensis (nom. inval.)]KAF7325250.1 hypothetical protein MKEN_00569700 [Mycena kentingensis (nom. inval.)]
MSLRSAERRRAVRDALRVYLAYTPRTRLAALDSDSPGAEELGRQLLTWTGNVSARAPRPPPPAPSVPGRIPVVQGTRPAARAPVEDPAKLFDWPTPSPERVPRSPEQPGSAADRGLLEEHGDVRGVHGDGANERVEERDVAGEQGAGVKDDEDVGEPDPDDELDPDIFAVREQLGLGPVAAEEYIALYTKNFHVQRNGTRRNKKTTRIAGLGMLVRGYEPYAQPDVLSLRRRWSTAAAVAFPSDEPISALVRDYTVSTNLDNQRLGEWYVQTVNDVIRDAAAVDARGLATHLINSARIIESHAAWLELPTRGNSPFTRTRTIKAMYMQRGMYSAEFKDLSEDEATQLLLEEKHKKQLGRFQDQHKEFVRGRSKFYDLYMECGPHVLVDRQWTPATMRNEGPEFFEMLQELIDYPSHRQSYDRRIDAHYQTNLAAVLGIADALNPGLRRLLKDVFKRFPSKPAQAQRGNEQSQ